MAGHPDRRGLPEVARARTGRRGRALSVRVHGVRLRNNATGRLKSADDGEVGRPRDAFLVVNIANFRAQKNHGLLVEAAARVVGRARVTVFLLAGPVP